MNGPSYWCSAPGADSAWLIANLDARYKLKKVVVDWAYDQCCEAYKLWVSTLEGAVPHDGTWVLVDSQTPSRSMEVPTNGQACLLYTSDAADEEDSVDLGGRRIIKKKKIRVRWE
eukprot:TRINITY_DN39711_c0_g1_i1.p1 TRINITY_DN39711_c0_g1~~TRINITY_DN39711_c0_g1_i1.p1  ORF type:complete len:115 (+),score=27.23 TRINITY_DN39711_c0_g1_i1:146-490(+)